MSGHSKWATIKRKKGATDAARGKLFSKIIREITVAARIGGDDINANTRLRLSVDKAKAANMPFKNIENAIAKGSGKAEGTNYEEVTFEGYAAGGVALIVTALTDNNNRTVAEIRHLITKYGGNMGETNCVAWMFQTKGIITTEKSLNDDDMMELIIEAGADDLNVENDVYEVTTSVETFEEVKKIISDKGIKIIESNITKIPDNTIKLEGDSAQKVLKLINALEDQDDVQNVYANFDIDITEMEKL